MRSAQAEWQRLTNKRQGFERRCERYANFTLPRLFTSENWDENSDELSHDWQSVGAQAVNHVVNKLMLALFAPSRPFMRLEADPEWLATLPEGLTSSMVEEALAEAERKAVKELDTLGEARAKLYSALANLVALGNVLLELPAERGESPDVYNLRDYVVRRTGKGKVKCLIIREVMEFDELEQDVQAAVIASGNKFKPDRTVSHFRRIELNSRGGYDMTQHIDTIKLPAEFDGAWSEETMPYRVLVWNLKRGNHYGTGLVEDYAGDFGGLSSLSEAQIKGAILSSEYRWLVNPAGMTKVEDLENSENGAALPGQKDDVSLIANSKASDLAIVQDIGQEYIQRIGRGFLLGTAVTRDAERVTAQEIRMQAQELETSFGGTYSQIAVDMQLPIARWLLRNISMELKDTQIKLSIITGLDALSRSGDLDALRAALTDCGLVANVQNGLQRLNLGAIFQTIFAGHGLPANKYVKSDEQVAAEQQQAMQAQSQQAMTEQAVAAGVEANAQQGTRQ